MDQAEGIRVPVSVGELLDKITILEIKAARIDEPTKRADVLVELGALSDVRDRHGLVRLEATMAHLKAVNTALWDIEEAIRDCERLGDFGPRFVALARSIYRMNDERARLKQELNRLTGSALVERKSYV